MTGANLSQATVNANVLVGPWLVPYSLTVCLWLPRAVSLICMLVSRVGYRLSICAPPCCSHVLPSCMHACRYALGAASEVAILLDAIVQQVSHPLYCRCAMNVQHQCEQLVCDAGLPRQIGMWCGVARCIVCTDCICDCICDCIWCCRPSTTGTRPAFPTPTTTAMVTTT